MIERSKAGTTVAARQPLDAYHPSAGTPDEIMDLVRRTKLLHPTTAEVLVPLAIVLLTVVTVAVQYYLAAVHGHLIMPTFVDIPLA